ncbi:acetate/propionate family kinase [Sulfitobacter guttiformis]|uniref:Acetate kinase n=1 Tax=Sulfitobacter guttiformis TaxID=74349 RepID=A0A420DJA1_9RHOB|nr:acetate/propionate family kinase [Sulfitobacter guttiformis]KIN71906.1 Acetate kinase [Sulfitobacter guttiformis KCTC 32187]RKE94285.1 acetate kinase [Sulfitobacter guttiformis]
MTDAILVLNAGSSSLKFALYSDIIVGHDEAVMQTPLLRGKIANIGNAAIFSAYDAKGNVVPPQDHMICEPSATHDTLIPALLEWLQNHGGGATIKAAGHRVVHGGRAHAGPARITNTLMAELEDLVPLAPLHQPHNLAAIRHVAAFTPDLPQIACFDTSFHRTQDRLAQIFALPRALTDQGILRYGFHGLSYEYIAGRLPSYLGQHGGGRVIVAHLGNGASMCALKNRQSVATSMGFTALDGLMMGRRCGALDPGVVLHLLEQKRMSPDEITQLLYRESGLLGVSGISNDMASLEASTAPEAREAIELFCYRAACELAALCAAIGGLDAIVFTAGIGEKSALVRSMIIDRLAWMGVALDPTANEGNQTRINSDASKIVVLVIPTDEESVIARATRQLLHVGNATPAH